MPAKETDLKQQLKDGRLARVYFLYGKKPIWRRGMRR